MDYPGQPLITRLASAIYADDLAGAKQLLNDCIFSSPTWGEAVLEGKRVVLRDSLPGLSEGTNLDDCINKFGHHNGWPQQIKEGKKNGRK